MKNKLLIVAVLSVAAFAGYVAREPASTAHAEKSSGVIRIPQSELPIDRSLLPEAEAKVVYVSEKEAKASGKPILYVVTNSKNCQPCAVLKGYLATPMVAGALRSFAVVKILDQSPSHPWMRHYQVTTVPTLVFLAPNGQSMTMPGLPPGLPAFLHGINEMEAWCAGKLKLEEERNSALDAEFKASHTPTPTLAPHDAAAHITFEGRSSGRPETVRDYSKTCDGPTRSIVVRRCRTCR